MSACRSCAAEIHWCVTPGGKRIPLDAEPTPDGNLIMEDGHPPWALPCSAPAGTDVGTPRYKSHFATCKDAKDWRKK